MDLEEKIRKIEGLKNNTKDKDKSYGEKNEIGAARSSQINSIKKEIHQELVERLSDVIYRKNIGDAELSLRVRGEVQRIIEKNAYPLTGEEKSAIVNDFINDVTGYGPIEEFLKDDDITEIMVNNPKKIYVEKFGKIYRTNRTFLDEAHLMQIINKIVSRVGRRVDESSPYVDARLPDGSRVNVIIHPLVLNGPSITIRKFSAEPFTIEDFVGMGTCTQKVADFLEACVKGKINIICSGGTGTGKTTTLNVLSSFIPNSERLITIEDAAELKLSQTNIVRLEARPPNIEGKGEVTIRDLVRNALRMRPDRIIIGEVRGGESLDMLQAMNTGHDGSLSTVHANSPRDVLSRLETMVLMAGVDIPMRAIREQISSAVNLVVHMNRLKDGTRRFTKVTEVMGMEGDVITLQDLFVFDYMGVDEEGRFKGRIKSTGIRPGFIEKLNNVGIDIPGEVFKKETK
ncbi:MAG: CpaF family protein [Actinomycetota bacterium]|nr:CpaF family protein [Actinomycetota bacterium]